jgi:hypothetical protein
MNFTSIEIPLRPCGLFKENKPLPICRTHMPVKV